MPFISRKEKLDRINEIVDLTQNQHSLLVQLEAVRTRMRSILDANKKLADENMNLQSKLEQEQSENAYMKAYLSDIAGGDPEQRIYEAGNYEFLLRIMKKQLEDQLIYINGGDEKLVSTVQFTSVKELATYLLTMISTALDSRIQHKERKET